MLTRDAIEHFTAKGPQPKQDDVATALHTEDDKQAASARASAEWEEKLRNSEDLLEVMLSESKAFRAERKARKAEAKAQKEARRAV